MKYHSFLPFNNFFSFSTLSTNLQRLTAWLTHSVVGTLHSFLVTFDTEIKWYCRISLSDNFIMIHQFMCTSVQMWIEWVWEKWRFKAYTYHLLAWVRGLYFLYLIFHSMTPLHPVHRPHISRLFIIWIFFVLSCMLFLKALLFWYFGAPFFCTLPRWELMIGYSVPAYVCINNVKCLGQAIFSQILKYMLYFLF